MNPVEKMFGHHRWFKQDTSLHSIYTKKERTHLENDFTAINCCLVIMPPPVFFGQLFAEECANLSDTICLCLLV